MWDEDGKDNTFRDFQKTQRMLEHAGYPEKPVFVHCHMGLNRATSVAFYLLMVGKGKLKPAVAYERIVRLRPEAGITYSLEALDAALRQNRPTLTPEAKANLLREWTKYIDTQWDNERVRLNGRAIILRRRMFDQSRPYFDGRQWRVARMSR